LQLKIIIEMWNSGAAKTQFHKMLAKFDFNILVKIQAK